MSTKVKVTKKSAKQLAKELIDETEIKETIEVKEEKKVKKAKKAKEVKEVKQEITEIPIYPALYIHNANDKPYEWSIKIEKTDNGTYNIISSHGQIDGKKVIHTTEITEGKANRTILEQAILETNRKWTNKKEKELYNETLHDLSDKTDPKMVVRPMLANTFSLEAYSKKGRSFKIPFPAFIQRKYDGIRCLAYLVNGKVRLESRTGKEFENFDVLKGKLEKILNKKPKHFYLDGELYTDQYEFEAISGLIRLSEKKCTDEDKLLINQIEYHIYDFFDTNNPNIIFEDRIKILNEMLPTNDNLIKQVETILINDVNDVKVYHDKFVSDGYEGIMVRDKDGIYEPNKRSKFLQKFKEFDEDEFKIIGFHEGDGSEKGAIVWECITKDNKEFDARPQGTFESRKKLFLNGEKYIGKNLTVKFFGYTNDHKPRMPVGKAIRENY
jgi:ATP-dependent DNA ligase